MLDPLQDAVVLRMRIESLQKLLQLQLRQVEALDHRLYSAAPAGVAARRLLALKRAENGGNAPRASRAR